MPTGARWDLLRKAVMKENQKDLDTIDWVEEHETAEGFHRGKGYSAWQAMWENSQGWLSAVTCGIMLGFIACVIDAASIWVSSFRVGICAEYFWLPRHLCCDDEEECEGWYSWGAFLLGRATRESAIETTNFFLYVGWATVFAAMSAFLCKYYAPYAAGGGINEVKTILSGINIRRFLNNWALLMKAAGVCLSTGSGLVCGKEGPFIHIGCLRI